MIPQLRDYQSRGVKDVQSCYMQGRRAPLFVLPTGGGKCLAKGTPILMYDATTKKVEDVLPGDLLAGPDGKPRTVLSICAGREAMYKVTPAKGDSYVVNESHVLSLVISGTDKVSACGKIYNPGDVVNISVRDYITTSKTFKHVAKGYRSPTDFEPNLFDLPIAPYFLGLWLGDGSCRTATITSGDNEIASYVHEYAESINCRIRIEYNSKGSSNYHFVDLTHKGRSGCKLKNALKEMRVYKNKHIPLNYKRATKQERFELLAGFIDADGHYTGKGYDITLKSEVLLDDVIFVARSLGLSAYKSKCKKTCTNTNSTGTYYRCSISGHVDAIPCKVKRKQASPRKQKKDNLRTGITVDCIGEGDYFGFEIDGDHLFMLGDFTVTHNTIFFAYIAHTAAMRGKRVLIIVHRVELLEQTIEKLRLFGVAVGAISPAYTPVYAAPVQVCMVQSMQNRMRHYPAFDLIITDECHHIAAGTYLKIVNNYPNAYQLGVTATPVRTDGKGLGIHAGGIYDSMVLGPSTRDLIDMEFLVQPVVYSPPSLVDMTGVRKSGGDYNRKDLAERTDKKSITGDAVDHYLSTCMHQPGVVFCASVEHARHVASEFENRGIKSRAVDGGMEKADRKRALAGLADGSVSVITSCDLISEGVDIPAIAYAGLLRPTESTGLFLQQVGRALRPFAGKDRAVIMDHVGNVGTIMDGVFVPKHGLPDEVRDWTLDGEVKAPKPKKDDTVKLSVHQCHNCYGVFAAHLRVCPFCDTARKVSARALETKDGELMLISQTELDRRERITARKEQGQAQTLEELQAIAAARGYRKGWAEYVFKSRQTQPSQ